MVCNANNCVYAAADVGLTAAAGAILAVATAGPVALTALAFAISSVAHKIFVLIAAGIGVKCNNRPLFIVLTMATTATVTIISILAMQALAIIATPGIVLLSLLGVVSCVKILLSARHIE